MHLRNPNPFWLSIVGLIVPLLQPFSRYFLLDTRGPAWRKGAAEKPIQLSIGIWSELVAADLLGVIYRAGWLQSSGTWIRARSPEERAKLLMWWWANDPFFFSSLIISKFEFGFVGGGGGGVRACDARTHIFTLYSPSCVSYASLHSLFWISKDTTKETSSRARASARVGELQTPPPRDHERDGPSIQPPCSCVHDFACCLVYSQEERAFFFKFFAPPKMLRLSCGQDFIPGNHG